ncbi:MAG: aminomethyl-transferring glycine dehydrogenase subunit GcvPA [Deltaproteobacteria bacterium]|nr:aminomethyl-transferring glycine dehydrogenase subunit GcvPA [Deltaproteobacteria bacterium]
MRYIPHTAADKRAMLEAIGVGGLDALFSAIPASLQLGRPLDVPTAMAEPDLRRHLRALAKGNVAMGDAPSFLGGGTYHHYAPTLVSQLLLRGELYTAYTPYQPEIAQGTLQIIFEFQTLVSELLAMEVVNASMYDGATALAEAALMALRVQSKKPQRVVLADTIHPQYLDVTRLFVTSAGGEVVLAGHGADGTVDLAAIERELAAGAAAVAVGYPNFFGGLDDVAGARALCDRHGALLIVTFSEAVAFGLVKPPGELGADIVAGEGQSLGVPAQFGGPHLGLFATREGYLRQMPGRIAGESVDSRGNRGFVLTMSTREQHIRREKATSNICTNVALMATAATIAMTCLGPDGLASAARASHLRAEQTKAALTALPGWAARYTGPTFDEFVVTTPRPAQGIVDDVAARGVAAGIAIGERELLVCATEMTSSEDVAALVEAVRAAG